MFKFVCFAVSRYSGFVSHLSAFLAGLSLVISLPLGLIFLAVSIVLGSLSAFLRSRAYAPPVSPSSSPADLSSLADILSQLSNHP